MAEQFVRWLYLLCVVLAMAFTSSPCWAQNLTQAPSPPEPSLSVTVQMEATAKEVSEQVNDSVAASKTESRALANEEAELDRTKAIYDTARQIFGGDHVVLSPALYTGARCIGGMGNVFECSTQRRGGVAGLITVPLVGMGGGHGWFDWWPVIETDVEADVFYRFEKSFRRLRDAMMERVDLANDSNASPELLEKRFTRLVGAFESVLKRQTGKEDDGFFAEDADRLSRCLGTVVQAPTLADDNQQRAPTGEPRLSCEEGIKTGSARRGWTMRNKLRLVDALWHEYDLLVDTVPMSRHNFLAGPLVGVPITEGTHDIMYGLGVEVGLRWYLRLTMGGGLQSSMRGEHRYLGFDSVGWWFGLGLSGQLSDAVINAALGSARYFSPDATRAP